VIRADGREEELRSADKTQMAAGDVFWLDTPSGGGFTPE
jgi:5-oxoprolinase (ATP-hydrolysing)